VDLTAETILECTSSFPRRAFGDDSADFRGSLSRSSTSVNSRSGTADLIALQARIGIHVGEIALWNNNSADTAHGAKPLEKEGLVKSVAARRLRSNRLPTFPQVAFGFA
jgi:hypothetical protein